MNAIPNMNISDITNKVLSSTPNAGEDIAKKISTTDTSTADNSTAPATSTIDNSTTNTANSTSTDNKATATPVDFKYHIKQYPPFDWRWVPDPSKAAVSPKGKDEIYTYDDFLDDIDSWYKSKPVSGYADRDNSAPYNGDMLLSIKKQVSKSNASEIDKKKMLDDIDYIRGNTSAFDLQVATGSELPSVELRKRRGIDTAPAANANATTAPAAKSTTAAPAKSDATPTANAPVAANATTAAPAKSNTAPAANTPAPTPTPTPTPTPDDATKDDGNTKKKEYKDNHFMTAAEQEHSDNVIAEADKVINDPNASEADKNEAYTNKIIENARQATAKTKSDEVEQDTNTAKDYAKGVGQVVDPEYAKNLPKTIIEAYNNGDFGTVGSDDAVDTLGYFILNTIGTGLTNSTQYFPGAYGGKGTQQTPAYQGMLSKELENAIQRKNDTINKKNDDARALVNAGAISQTSLNSAQNKWAQDQQQNVYAKTLEGYQQVAAALGDEVLGEYIQGLDKDKAATLSLGNLLLNGGDAQKGAALFIQALGPEKAKEALGKISKAVSDNTAFTSKEKTILDAQNSQALAKVTADAGADAAIKTAKGTLDTELAKMSATAQFEINKQIAIMQEKYALEKDLEKAKAGIQKELMQMQHKYNMTEDALKAAETMVVSVVGTGAKAAAMASDKHAKLYYRIGGWRK